MLLPFTKAMFSPLPTLFFTLLTNLWDRNTRGWSIHWNTLEEHFFALRKQIKLSTYIPYLALTKTTTYRTGPRLQTKNKETGDRHYEKNTCIQLHRQTRRPGCDSKKGKKNRAWNPNKKKKEKRQQRRQRHRWKEMESTESHILSSRQILGPMTLAAPDTRRKAKCFGGHGAESPHLYLRGRDSAEIWYIS